MKTVVRIAVVLLVALAIRRYVWPWAQQEFSGTKAAATSTASDTGDGACARAAESASEVWGKGLARFVNPPYDLGEWTSFQNDVNAQIATAEQICITCTGPKCEDVRGALRDLRSLVGDLDRSIRSGSAPPGDIVQRQESIDKRIADAR